MKNSFAITWLSASALCSTLAFLAAGYYIYLLASALLCFITFDMSPSRKGNLYFAAGLVVSVASGLLLNKLYWTDNGISGGGVVIIIPALAIISFISHKFFSLQNNAK